MRSSVPCRRWIDSFSLLGIQVVSLRRDYYVSLACQVDFVRINPSRKTPQVLAVRGLRKHMTIGEVSLCVYWESGSYPETGLDEISRDLPEADFTGPIRCEGE